MWKNEFMPNGEATRFSSGLTAEWVKVTSLRNLTVENKNAKSFLRSLALPSDGAAFERCDEKVSLSTENDNANIESDNDTSMATLDERYGADGGMGNQSRFRLTEAEKHAEDRLKCLSQLNSTMEWPCLISSRLWGPQWSGKLIRHHCFLPTFTFFTSLTANVVKMLWWDHKADEMLFLLICHHHVRLFH